MEGDIIPLVMVGITAEDRGLRTEGDIIGIQEHIISTGLIGDN